MLPKPFPIPRFRQSTENNFQNKILTDTDRKYVVQTVYHTDDIHTEGVHVAKALIAKYEFLKDTEGDGEVCVFVYAHKTEVVNFCIYML